MAYLGRISAVLTANTRDFTRQIGTARRELQGFASQARGIQLNLDNRALNGTLTNLQRFRRTLQEIQRLQAAGVGAGLPNTRRLNDQFRAFEDLGRPLTDVKNRIEGLSNAIQAELYPELEKIQAGFRNLYRDIDNGSTTFERSAARIDNLRQRLIGLSRATAALSDLNSLTRQLNANNSGASFFAPRAQEALQRSLALRGQAQSLPARFRENPAFADLAVQAEENAERVERAAARVARANAEIEQYGANPNRLARRGRAQTELDAATRQQANINLGLQREVASAQIQQIVAPDAPRQADRLIERVRSLTAELRAIDGNRFNGLIASTAAIVDQFNRGETSANRARAAVDRLAQSLAAAGRVQAGRDIGRDLQEQADRLLFTERQRRQRTIQSAFDTATANVPAGDPRRRRAELERDITLRRDQLVSEVIPRTQGLADQARQSGDKQAIRDAEQVLNLTKQINAELTRGANLTQNKRYKDAADSLVKVDALLKDQKDLEEDIAKRVDISNAARRQTKLFLEQSGGLGEQLSQGARDAASDISVGRQFRGGIRDGGARIAIASEIDRIESSVAGLQQQIAEVAASNLGASQKISELNRLDNEIRETTSGLAEFIATQSQAAAAASGGVSPYSEDQIKAAMERGRNNAGSIGVGGAAAAQLAFQQGLFAIDDFISSTGGIEYKLRAIGNNITQLGLLLGQSGLIAGLDATRGLLIALGATLGANVAIAVAKFAFNTESAKEQTELLNKSLERQKSLAEALASSYDTLANSIANAGASQEQQRRSSRDRQIDELDTRRRERQRELVSSSDRGIIATRLQRQQLERDLEQPRSVFESEQDFLRRRVGIQQQIEELRRREQRAADFSLRRPISTQEATNALLGNGSEIRPRSFMATGITGGGAVRRDLNDIAARANGGGRRELERAAREQIDYLQNLRLAFEQAAKAGGPGGAEATAAIGTVDREIGRLTEILNRFTDVASENFQAADAIARRLFDVGDELEKARDIISKAFEELYGASAVGAELDRLSSVIEMLDRSANEAAMRGEDPSAFQQDADAARAMAKELTAASMAVDSFASALQRFSQSISRDLSSLEQRAEEARRADIAQGTLRSGGARERADRDVREARRAQRQFEDERAAAVERFEERAMRNGDRRMRRIREIDAMMATPMGEVGADGTRGGTAAERQAARDERRRLQAQVDAEVENDPAVRRARADANAATRRAEMAAMADQGRELLLRPGQRARLDLDQQLRKLDAALQSRIDEAIAAGRPQDIATIRNEDAEARKRLQEEAFRQQAPAIFGLADAVTNALLQGPSRAALQPTDISTVEGSRELTRLLRGDDAARDQANLVELQKEANRLLDLIANNPANIAN